MQGSELFERHKQQFVGQAQRRMELVLPFLPAALRPALV